MPSFLAVIQASPARATSTPLWPSFVGTVRVARVPRQWTDAPTREIPRALAGSLGLCRAHLRAPELLGGPRWSCVGIAKLYLIQGFRDRENRFRRPPWLCAGS